MFKNNTKSYILLSALMTGLLVLSFLIPGIGGVLQFLCAALYGVTVVKYHYGLVIASGFLILAVSVLFGGLGGLIGGGLVMILVGLSIGLGINLRLPLFKLIVICAVTYLASYMAIVWFTSGGDGFSTMIMSVMNESVDQALAIYEPMLQPEQFEAFRQMFLQLANTVITLLPSFLICFALVMAYLAIGVAKRFLTKSGQNMAHLAPFSDIRGDRVVSIGFLVLLLLLVFPMPPMAADAVGNVVVVLLFIYYAFGLALIDWWAMHKGMRAAPRIVLLVAVNALSFVFAMMPFVLVTGLGIVDSFVNLRRRLQQNMLL